MTFIPRLTRPEAGNKYYIRKASGGYSTAITGKPTDKYCDVLANCVGYAVGRFHEIAERPAFDLIDPVNAENLFANAKQHGLRTGSLPALGALVVWAKGRVGSGSDGAGHVAVVEQILTGGMIVTSESGYNAKKPFWTTVRKSPYDNGAAYTLLGFVYQPEASETDVPDGTIRRGDKGDAVRWMQRRLSAFGYLPPLSADLDGDGKITVVDAQQLLVLAADAMASGSAADLAKGIDGDFGKITLCALLAFQLENDLEADGVCGPKTKEALTRHNGGR